MAVINISISQELKDRFVEAFAEENRSALVARLIERAIEEREQKRKGEEAIERILARRTRATPMSTAEARKILAELRRA